jgi:secreted trypsin-like serine protease
VFKVDGTEIVFRFDAPGDPDVTELEGVSGDGDSGGPAYLERDGTIYVVGVGSAQDAKPVDKKLGHYGVLEMYPRVSSFAPWIRATLKSR